MAPSPTLPHVARDLDRAERLRRSTGFIRQFRLAQADDLISRASVLGRQTASNRLKRRESGARTTRPLVFWDDVCAPRKKTIANLTLSFKNSVAPLKTDLGGDIALIQAEARHGPSLPKAKASAEPRRLPTTSQAERITLWERPHRVRTRGHGHPPVGETSANASESRRLGGKTSTPQVEAKSPCLGATTAGAVESEPAAPACNESHCRFFQPPKAHLRAWH